MKTKLLLLFLAVFSTFQINAQCSRTGTLTAIDDPAQYPVAGTTNLNFYIDGTKEVVFENDFATVQGLNLQVYLTTTERLGQGGDELLITTQPLQDDNGGMDTGDPITGVKTFTLPSSVNIDDYTYVIIQCINADVLWGRAELNTTTTGSDCSTVLSVEDNTLLTKINMYPNPASENFFIENNTQDKVDIKVFNIIGKQVVAIKNSQLKKEAISLSSLKSGVYLVEIKSNDQKIIKKLIKQ